AAAALAVLLGAGRAEAARFAVGLEPGASADAIAARLAEITGGAVSRELEPMRALTVEAPSARAALALPGVAYVERIDARRRLAFTPTDPLAARQWYLEQTRAFDTWAELPPLAPVRVAIVDSGIDAGHPEFEGRIADGRSFVPGDWGVDQQGHGTFVAGLIAANVNNAQGIAGMAFPAELLIAKVVRGDRSISLETEAKAIRWAIENGAQVINLSLGGLRDPHNPRRDTFSPLEAAAISYAYRNGAVLVAAVGNADQAPSRPWPFASYPAALPHVIGVSALARDGSVPSFSDRDLIYNDVAAPGQDILSTFPRQLTEREPACKNQGYSDCDPDGEYRRAEGTSFAAPQVAAAAALLLAVDPDLGPEQVANLITRAALDVHPGTGCKQCPLERDALSGWGRLDVAAAIAQALKAPPARDRLETNDDAGAHAPRIYGTKGQTVRATVDFWDDQTDVYRVLLHGRQRVSATLRGPEGAKLFLWTPGTSRVEGLSVRLQRRRVAQSVSRGAVQQFSYRAPARRGGWYYLQVKIGQPGAGPYTLSYAKR
ncbi:MAG: S8 family peptidase, partial [Gaiellaceae bacterium]